MEHREASSAQERIIGQMRTSPSRMHRFKSDDSDNSLLSPTEVNITQDNISFFSVAVIFHR